MMLWRAIPLSLFLVSLLVTPALAQDPAVEFLTYDNYADFDAAYAAMNVMTFEDHGAGDVSYGGIGYAEGGAVITATDGYLFLRSNGTNNGYIYGGNSGGSNPSGHHLRIDLPADTNAFAAHMTGFLVRQAGVLRVTLSTGQEFEVATKGFWFENKKDPRDWTYPSFFGVITAQPFEWVTIEFITSDSFTPTDYVVLDTVSFGHSDLLAPEPACGDWVVDEGEECDDGNLADADGCSAECMLEDTEFIGAQSDDQRECIVAMNKNGAKLARTMNWSSYRCIKYFGRDKLSRLGAGGDLDSCLRADVRGHEAWRTGRLMDMEEDRCLANPESMPDFAFTSSATVFAGAHAANKGLLSGFFGRSVYLNSVIVKKRADREARSCQRNTVKYTHKLFHAKMKTFYRCKRSALAGWHRFTDPADFDNADPDQRVESLDELEAEILACVDADPRHRIARYRGWLSHKIRRSCDMDDMHTRMQDIFPGECAAAASLMEENSASDDDSDSDSDSDRNSDPGVFTSCLDRMTDCHFCRSMNTFDGFDIDCDDYDNGMADGSCADPSYRDAVMDRLQAGIAFTHMRYVLGDDADLPPDMNGDNYPDHLGDLSADEPTLFDGILETPMARDDYGWKQDPLVVFPAGNLFVYVYDPDNYHSYSSPGEGAFVYDASTGIGHEFTMD